LKGKNSDYVGFDQGTWTITSYHIDNGVSYRVDSGAFTPSWTVTPAETTSFEVVP